MLMKKSFIFVPLLFLSACFSSKSSDDKITRINLLNHNGMAETISEKERLVDFNKTDFLTPQPYQKVSRVYGRDKAGNIPSRITSYHPNGQVKQYLEAMNNRAFGLYNEWHSNGQLKIESHVIGGISDLNTQAEESWLFDGINRAWDEEGHLLAEISYAKGELEGEARYYHKNGTLWKISPFAKHMLNGSQVTFLEDGSLFQTADFVNGVKEGVAKRYWDPTHIAFEEHYKEGKLLKGIYLDTSGKSVSEISDGIGFKTLFGKTSLIELHEYRNGVEEGVVKIFDEKGFLSRLYEVKNGEKEGEEIVYFPSQDKPQLLMSWRSGLLHGIVKTWYENGGIESQKEMSQNKKNGMMTAWYKNGALMLVEEYENDKLIKGEYYRMNDSQPLSKVDKGRGLATLFDQNGTYLKKVYYQDSKPIE